MSLPYLQEQMPMTPTQTQRAMDEVRTEPVGVLIQKSAQLEPPPQVMYEQGE